MGTRIFIDSELDIYMSSKKHEESSYSFDLELLSISY